MHRFWRQSAGKWRRTAQRLLATAACLVGSANDIRADFRPSAAPQRTCSLAAADQATVAWYEATGCGERPRLLSESALGLHDDGRDWRLYGEESQEPSDPSAVSKIDAVAASIACPNLPGVSLIAVLELTAAAAEKGTELVQDWIRRLNEKPEQSFERTIAAQQVRLSEEVGANSDCSGPASSGDAIAAEPAPWCGAMLTAPSGERTTESQEESNCEWAGCGGLGPLQWPSPDGGWRRGIAATPQSKAAPLSVDAAELADHGAATGTIVHMLAGREHVRGDALVRQINALNDGLTRRQWEQSTFRALSIWRPGKFRLPALRPTDLAAVRSMYFWWDSAQPHRRADRLTNDTARMERDAEAGSPDISHLTAESAPALLPAPFEPIIDGPGRYLYLRSEWTPPTAELLARAPSSLTSMETAPACGHDAANECPLDDQRCGDPMEQWVGCDAFARYAARPQRGISADEAARWLGPAVRWFAPMTQELQMQAFEVIARVSELPRLIAVAAQELALLRRAADSLATAGGTSGQQNVLAPDRTEAKRPAHSVEPRGL